MPPDKIQAYLKNILSVYPTIEDYAWVSANGYVVASSNPEMAGKIVMSRQYFLKVRWGEKKVITDTIIDDNGNFTVPIARAIYKDGKLAGISVLWLNPNKLNVILPIDRRGVTGSFGFVDRYGLIAYRHGSPDLSITNRRLGFDAPTRMALEGEVVNIRNYNTPITNTDRMGVAIPIPEIGWASFVSVSVDEVLSDVRSKMFRETLILLVVISVSILASILLSRHFTGPIKKLQNAALEISRRNLKARADITGNDELATTGQIFDEMASRIEELENNRLQFLQTAAHELRNPMSGVKGLLSLIKRKMLMGQTVKNVTKMINRMEKEIDRLSNLLNQILDAFQVQRESVNLSFEFKCIELIDIINDSIEPYQLTSEKCDIIFLPPDKEIYVKGDRSRLEEVFRNIINNAIKYSPDGGTITVDIEVDDEWVTTSVDDCGIGIAENKLQSVFDCFGRVVDSQKKDPGGMGLGLYICKEIVQKHRGKIWAKSDGINGSIFYIKLPISRQEEE